MPAVLKCEEPAVSSPEYPAVAAQRSPPRQLRLIVPQMNLGSSLHFWVIALATQEGGAEWHILDIADGVREEKGYKGR